MIFENLTWAAVGFFGGALVVIGVWHKYMNNWMVGIRAKYDNLAEKKAKQMSVEAVRKALSEQREAIEVEMVKRKSEIEIAAMKKLVDATEEARMTKKPVTIEFAGIKETFEISPPSVFGILRNNLRT